MESIKEVHKRYMYTSNTAFKKLRFLGNLAAQLVEHETPDFRDVSSSRMFGMETT